MAKKTYQADGGRFGVMYNSDRRQRRGSTNVHGEVNSGNSGIAVSRGNSCTDPKSAIIEISHGVRINGQIYMGHYDINGFPVEGPIKINNMRIDDDEGKLVSRLQFVALTSNIKDNEWFDEEKALLSDEYIERQYDSRQYRGSGYVYPESFFEKIKISRK